MKKKKYKRGKGIYIAGPMTGYVNYNAEAFNRTETLLRVGEGVPIVNPSRIVMSIDALRSYTTSRTWRRYL